MKRKIIGTTASLLIAGAVFSSVAAAQDTIKTTTENGSKGQTGVGVAAAVTVLGNHPPPLPPAPGSCAS